jgi:L,D-peptidoglycan transpeptidase YkuD (ErfK/YbiS/YcfS/YnhG family)
MDPRKLLIAAAVVGAVTGCSGSTHRSASTVAVSPTTSATTTATTVAPTTTTATTVAPTTTTTRYVAPSTTTTTRYLAPPTTAGHVDAASSSACPANTASHLSWTGSARQLITVEATSYSTDVATVELWQKEGSCWVSAGGPWSGFIGEYGFTDNHSEGDMMTPTGAYGVGPTMYGIDPSPGVKEPYHHLICGDWWDENPSSPEYNTFQHPNNSCSTTPNPYGGGSEALWTVAPQYDSFAVIDFNTDPVVAGKGSAIFFHVSSGSYTAGCVSVPAGDLVEALRWIDPSQSPMFVMGPSSEIDRF